MDHLRKVKLKKRQNESEIFDFDSPGLNCLKGRSKLDRTSISFRRNLIYFFLHARVLQRFTVPTTEIFDDLFLYLICRPINARMYIKRVISRKNNVRRLKAQVFLSFFSKRICLSCEQRRPGYCHVIGSHDVCSSWENRFSGKCAKFRCLAQK